MDTVVKEKCVIMRWKWCTNMLYVEFLWPFFKIICRQMTQVTGVCKYHFGHQLRDILVGGGGCEHHRGAMPFSFSKWLTGRKTPSFLLSFVTVIVLQCIYQCIVNCWELFAVVIVKSSNLVHMCFTLMKGGGVYACMRGWGGGGGAEREILSVFFLHCYTLTILFILKSEHNVATLPVILALHFCIHC